MKKLLIVAVVTGAIAFAAIASMAQAKGKLETTISMHDGASIASVDGSHEASFDVTRSYAFDRDVMWVTNKCFDENGFVVTKVDLPIQWGTWESLDGFAGPFPTAGVSCMAYTTLRPWQDRTGDAVIEYTP